MPLITFEGIDGAGKTTLIETCRQALLADHGVHAVVGSDACLHSVVARQLKPYWTQEQNPHIQYAMVMAARCISTEAWLRPALHSGEVVLYDRYVDTTMAYQGAQGVDPGRIMQDHIDLQLPIPDLTIILDLPVHAALSRRGAPRDHIEGFGIEFFEEIRARYLSFPTEVGRHVVVDANSTAEEVFAHCMTLIRERVLRPQGMETAA